MNKKIEVNESDIRKIMNMILKTKDSELKPKNSQCKISFKSNRNIFSIKLWHEVLNLKRIN